MPTDLEWDFAWENEDVEACQLLEEEMLEESWRELDPEYYEFQNEEE